MAEVTYISGEKGNFEVDIYQKARYVDTDKCIACNACAEKCPKKVNDSYNENLIKRKAIYLKYPQAVPLKYVIDKNNCIYFKNGKCKACQKFCPTGAIDFEEKSEQRSINVGSIILALGFTPFDPSNLDIYGYGKHPNVITSMDMERILSASGPTQGHLVKMSNKKEEPRKIAWLQCIGSRDMNRCNNAYCSSVCCMYSIKEAMIAKEHSNNNLECVIFYIDLRTHGKDFEYYYLNAKNKGVKFRRARIHTIDPLPNSDQLLLRYATEEGNISSEIFDMAVLSVGVEIEKNLIDLTKKLGIEHTMGNFCKTTSFNPASTSKEGIYVCGVFQGPKDIPQSVIDASAAANAASEILNKVRYKNTRSKIELTQKNVIGKRTRIGVFICMCGTNIASVVDVSNVKTFALKLPYVEYVDTNLYSCSKDSQDKMVEIIKKYSLNRIVVAACTPKTHETLFQETLISAELNKYLFEMCNIRNHVSWVHKKNPKLATKKAKNLVRMAVAKASLISPLEETKISVNQSALVIGGGLAGISAALSLSSQGYSTYIVEKSNRLGGNALQVYKTKSNENVQNNLNFLIEKIKKEQKIVVYLNTEISNVEGFVGNFNTTLSSKKESFKIKHGVIIVATGGYEYQTPEYKHGTDPRIMTSLDLDKKLINKAPLLKKLKAAVFIQCVGSRDSKQQGYCSRLCCSHSVLNALELKKINPKLKIYILYRDMRTYGENEYLFSEARNLGVIFIRYDLENKPRVSINQNDISVNIHDPILNRMIEINTDIITLASAIIPNENDSLSKLFKIPINNDKFFVEKHAKLGPSEFATSGIFLCGLAHYPKPIDESILQANASVSKAIALLAKKEIYTSGTIACVEPSICSSCKTCVSICPYSAPFIIEHTSKVNPLKAEINPILCKGCGICAASCRSGAIHLKGFDNNQIFAQISAM